MKNFDLRNFNRRNHRPIDRTIPLLLSEFGVWGAKFKR